MVVGTRVRRLRRQARQTRQRWSLAGLTAILFLASLVIILFIFNRSLDQTEVPTSFFAPDEPIQAYTRLVAALRRAGAEVQYRGDELIEQPFFPYGTRARVITVNGQKVQLIRFTPQARQTLGPISQDGAKIGEREIVWSQPPHFYRYQNLIVLYVGQKRSIGRLLETLLGRQFAGGGFRDDQIISLAISSPLSQALTFITVASGTFMQAPPEKSQQRIIQSAREWQAIKNDIFGDQTEVVWPVFNFNTTTILAVFQGLQPHSGAQVFITGVREEAFRIKVTVEESLAGASCFVAPVLTSPYHLVQLPKLRKPIIFLTIPKVIECAPTN